MDSYLMHYGVLGMKWGVRRFQNPDGSYTEEGKKRRAGAEERLRKKDLKKLKKTIKSQYDSGKSWYSDGANNLISKQSTEFARRHIRDADIAKLQEKKQIFEKYKDVIEYESSDQFEKDFQKIYSMAHKKTLNYFTKNHPDKLKEWLSLVGGDPAELDRIRDFEHLYNGFVDEIYNDKKKKYEKQHPEVLKAKEAWHDYYITSREIGKSFIKYSEDSPITGLNSWGDRYRDVISKSINYNELINKKIP